MNTPEHPAEAEEQQEALYRMPRPETPHHIPMPMEKRAAQFAPFAALEGFEQSIEACSGEHEKAPPA